MENARKSPAGLLAGLQRPDFSGLPAVNLDAMLENLGERADPPGKKKRPPPGEAAGIEGLPTRAVRVSTRRQFYDLATSRRAVAHLGRLPDPDETFHCLMGGDYHGFDLVIAVQDLAAAPVETLHVTTLGFNRHNMAHLCGMIDGGRVGRAALVCSEYFAGADTVTFNYARAELAARGSTLVAARNHSKVLPFAIGARRYVVESSANLRSCNNLEQFTLCQSAEVYDFHRAWIERCIAHASA